MVAPDPSPFCPDTAAPRGRRWNLIWLAGICLALAAAATAAQVSDATFMAVVRNASNGGDECLAFKGNGHDPFPQRYNWGGGPYCGFPGGKEPLLANRQAIWTFEDLGNDQYIIRNASRGSDECLIFSGNGTDAHPSRHNWGPGAYCGYPGGRDALLANRQAIWKLHHLDGDRYAITNASRGSDECLIFSSNGHATFPERYNWGPGPSCGLDGGIAGLLANGQAVFRIERIRIDDFVVPQAWLDGYVILQNVMHAHQRLHVGHDGNGQLYTQWGDDHAYRWKVEPTGDGHFFYLRNALHGHQRLHVGHDGNGRLYASWGDDDAYRWTAEPVGNDYLLRNKKYPHQRVHVGHDGNFLLYTGFGNDAAYQWSFQVLQTLDAPADNTFRLSNQYRYRYVRFDNGRYPDQRLHAGHDGNGQIYTGGGDDLAYQWQIVPSPEAGFVYLINALHPSQRLRSDPGGSGHLSSSEGSGDPFEWKIEPNALSFFLTSRQNPGQRVQVAAHGSGDIWGGYGDSAEHRWSLRLASEVVAWRPHDEACREPTDLLERVFEVCFYPGENQVGDPWCALHAEVFPGNYIEPFKADLPLAVALNARSVRVDNCASGSRSPTAFVYDQPGQRSDTTVVHGSGNLGAVAGRAHSYQLLYNNELSDGTYVCLHKGDNGGGAKHCQPLEWSEPVLDLGIDFNDQVRSVSVHPTWFCASLELWHHHRQGGQRIEVASNENLSNRFFYDIEDPLDFGRSWADVVSSFRFFVPFSLGFCG